MVKNIIKEYVPHELKVEQSDGFHVHRRYRAKAKQTTNNEKSPSGMHQIYVSEWNGLKRQKGIEKELKSSVTVII